jgi:hypothetical protein
MLERGGGYEDSIPTQASLGASVPVGFARVLTLIVVPTPYAVFFRINRV